MIVENGFRQLSDEWFQQHAGVLGAASADKVITSTGKRSTQRKDLLFKLLAESILGEKEQGYTNPTMDAGTEREDESRDWFRWLYETDVHEVAMCYKNEKKDFLCSPDGLIKKNGEWVAGLEMKNPLAKTHVSYLFGKKLPTKYFVQVQMSLYVTELPKWYFMSYFPKIDPFVIEVFPDKDFHKILEIELGSFCRELESMKGKLKHE